MKIDCDEFLQAYDAQINIYSKKGFFSSLVVKSEFKNSITYRFKWHLEQFFELVVNKKTKKLTFPCILSNVDKKGSVDIKFRLFIKSLIGEDLEKHQRLAKHNKSVRIINRNGTVSLSIMPEDEDYAHFMTQVIGAAHQVYTCFLRDGGFDDYLIDAYNIELDTYW